MITRNDEYEHVINFSHYLLYLAFHSFCFPSIQPKKSIYFLSQSQTNCVNIIIMSLTSEKKNQEISFYSTKKILFAIIMSNKMNIHRAIEHR
jgi:hypothetical protein